MKKKIRVDIKGFFNKKENLALLTMAVVLCAGVALTSVKNSVPLHDGDVLVDSQTSVEKTLPETDKTKQTAQTEQVTTLDAKRAELELERNELIGGYNETIKNAGSDEERKNAQKQKDRLSKYMEQEVAIESIISTKNLPDSFVIITDNMVTVTVDEQELKQNTVTKICNVVMTETGRTADKIIIQSLY